MTTIPNISHGTGSGTSRITPPSAPASLAFTLPQLAGSMARAAAMSKAAPSVVTGFTLAFDGLINTLVDTSCANLTFLTDIEDLADNMHSAFSGFFGAGMADLYMTQLGCAFRCNGREIIGRGKVFDFAYDAGRIGGADLIAVEAKGTLTAGATLAQIRTTARNGYANQVFPHLGSLAKGSTIVHGYGICTGSQIKRGVHCEMHVEETPAAIRTGSAAPLPAGAGGTSFRQANGALAVRNYRDVFRLLREDGILGAIEAGLQGNWQHAQNLGRVPLGLARWRGDEYIVRSAPTFAPCCESTLGPLFGLRRAVGERFLQGLSNCMRHAAIPLRFPTEIPVREMDVARESRFRDGGAEFPDGLAYFGLMPPQVSSDQIAFDPLKGLT